jgi:hypothetical protein
VQKYENSVWIAGEKGHVSYDVERVISEIASVPQDLKSVILIGDIHPLTVKAILSRTDRVDIVLSTYAGFDEDGRNHGYLGKTFVAFWNHGGGTVMGKLTFVTQNGRLRVTALENTILDGQIRDDPDTRRRLDRFFNSPAFVKAIIDDPFSNALPPPTKWQFESSQASASYVGAAECSSCHSQEYSQWKTTQHATAFTTLRGAHRTHHPGCVSCHVVGFGISGGFSMLSSPTVLEHVGCEACHGPGSEHAQRPTKANISRAVSTRLCETCHTPEHSEFSKDPDRYLSDVVHSPKASP